MSWEARSKSAICCHSVLEHDVVVTDCRDPLLTFCMACDAVVEVTVRITPLVGGTASVLVSNSLTIDGLQFNLVDDNLEVPDEEGDFEDLEVGAVGDVSDWNVSGGSNGAILAFAFTATGNIVLPASNDEVEVSHSHQTVLFLPSRNKLGICRQL